MSEKGGGKGMTWHRLDEELPPERVRFLLWRAMSDTDGGFPAIARRVRYDGESVIRWKSADEGWQALEAEEYKDCRWALVKRPEE